MVMSAANVSGKLHRSKNRARNLGVRPLRESELYSTASTATKKDRKKSEAKHKAHHQRRRLSTMRQIASMRDNPLGAMPQTMPEGGGAEAVGMDGPDLMQQPQTSIGNAGGARSNQRPAPSFTDRMRARIQEAKKKKKAKAAKAAKGKDEEHPFTAIQDLISHGLNRGGVLDSPGESLYTWLTASGPASAYQSIQDVLKIQLIKGELGFLVPNKPSKKIPGSKWVTHLYTITWFAVVGAALIPFVFGIVMLGLVAMAISGISIGVFADAFGIDFFDAIGVIYDFTTQ